MKKSTTDRSLNWLVALFLLAAFAAISMAVFRESPTRVIVLTTQDGVSLKEALKNQAPDVVDQFTRP